MLKHMCNANLYSNVQHRDELHPSYPLSMHYKWLVDIVVMPMGLGQMKYLVLARKDLTNQVEGRALRNKTTSAVCKFLLEDVICQYRCVGKIVADSLTFAFTSGWQAHSTCRYILKLCKYTLSSKRGCTSIIFSLTWLEFRKEGKESFLYSWQLM